MFLSSCLLLVPMILATKREFYINNYTVKIDDHLSISLESIEVVDDPPKDLNLSGLSLEEVYDKACKNITQMQILNRLNNSLNSRQDYLFAYLTNWEQLNLSHNIVFNLTSIGLNNLKVLDLSNTNLTNLMTSDFIGLNKSSVIYVKGTMHINTMSTEISENNSRTVRSLRGNDNQVADTRRFSDENTYNRGIIRIKICIKRAKLISVELHIRHEKVKRDCVKVRSFADTVLSLSSLGIAKFRKGWYKLRYSFINHIDLSSNNITRLTSETLNDLPDTINIVNLAHNNIKRLKKGVIVNKYLQEIYFTFNSIIKIEHDVFINTNLTTLTLSHNQLNHTKFAATLPPTLTKIELDYNEIAEISRKSFSKLNNLEVLMLNENLIMEIHTDSLRGLSSLRNLSLVSNKLVKIEASYFKALTALEVLDLKLNKITELDLGVFADLKNIKNLCLSWNLLWNLTNSLNDLPDSLEVLDLQSNILRSLKAGIFVNSPKHKLLLNNNNIENIENGTFNLPRLQTLVLTDNLLSVIDCGMLQGLKDLQSLWLDHNHIRIIQKGAFENLGSLCKLVIFRNPIKSLENESLQSLLQKKGCSGEPERIPIETIHEGVIAGSGDSNSNRLSESDALKVTPLQQDVIVSSGDPPSNRLPESDPLRVIPLQRSAVFP